MRGNDKIKYPVSKHSDTRLVAPQDDELIAILGGYNWDNLTITTDEYRSICKWADINYKFKETDAAKKLMEADASRAAMRHAQFHGMRMIAYISQFLEQGDDPVEWISGILSEMGFDAQWEYEEEEGEE